jgi:hypothetical protein
MKERVAIDYVSREILFGGKNLQKYSEHGSGAETSISR